ncbi:hypothetical protein [Microbacterium sp. Se63.02b]|uniref:hypothetical protein n=1 Tax=Microbacterium sp. Se63.02b TaxID=2709304 RepID=UPI001FCF28D6|nr:hypothetical protein [Microbacterium sp. Se63.02b]
MQRLLVALLAAFDAAIAAAVGLVVLLAPLTLLWTVAFGITADWGALWPLTGTLWEFGHGVPLTVGIPDALLVALSIRRRPRPSSCRSPRWPSCCSPSCSPRGLVAGRRRPGHGCSAR